MPGDTLLDGLCRFVSLGLKLCVVSANLGPAVTWKNPSPKIPDVDRINDTRHQSSTFAFHATREKGHVHLATAPRRLGSWTESWTGRVEPGASG